MNKLITTGILTLLMVARSTVHDFVKLVSVTGTSARSYKARIGSKRNPGILTA